MINFFKSETLLDLYFTTAYICQQNKQRHSEQVFKVHHHRITIYRAISIRYLIYVKAMNPLTMGLDELQPLLKKDRCERSEFKERAIHY